MKTEKPGKCRAAFQPVKVHYQNRKSNKNNQKQPKNKNMKNKSVKITATDAFITGINGDESYIKNAKIEITGEHFSLHASRLNPVFRFIIKVTTVLFYGILGFKTLAQRKSVKSLTISGRPEKESNTEKAANPCPIDGYLARMVSEEKLQKRISLLEIDKSVYLKMIGTMNDEIVQCSQVLQYVSIVAQTYAGFENDHVKSAITRILIDAGGFHLKNFANNLVIYDFIKNMQFRHIDLLDHYINQLVTMAEHRKNRKRQPDLLQIIAFVKSYANFAKENLINPETGKLHGKTN